MKTFIEQLEYMLDNGATIEEIEELLEKYGF